MLGGALWPGDLDRTDESELLDESGQPPELLRGNLADLARMNRWLGGTRLTLRGIDRLVDVEPGMGLSILDVGAGGMDIPRAVARELARRGARVTIIATDVSPALLALGERDGLHLAAADARRLPFVDESVDIAMCSLVLHHVDPAGAVDMLVEMRRVARRGIVVNDLVRGRLPYVGAWLLSRIASRNPLSRHDAPLSVRRAYTPQEMRRFAARAGLGRPVFDAFLGYRVALTAGRSR